MRILSIASLFVLFLCIKMHAQDSLQTISAENENDNLNFLLDQDYSTVSDTLKWVDVDSVTAKTTDSVAVATKINTEPFKPNPKKAVIYSAIFPGLGQIYNRKYWKLPIIYGGFLGFSYAISWNGRYYNDYSDAYKAIMQDDYLSQANVNKWYPFVQYGGTAPGDFSSSDISRYQDLFKRRKDYYRRYRDLSIIGALAFYGLCMIDAYVDAQLYDFDISPDLSLKVQPALFDTGLTAYKAIGIQCSITF